MERKISKDELEYLIKNSPMKILHQDELYFANYGEKKYVSFMEFVVRKIYTDKSLTEAQRDSFSNAYNIAIHREEIKRIMKEGNLFGTKYSLCNFGNYVETESNGELLNLLKEYYYERFRAYANGIGMYIWGDAGTGKTHALYTLANELAYSRECGIYFTSILDILNGIKKNFTDTEEQENIKERAKYARFLFLDDIGAEQLKENSDWYKTIIYEIIDYRYRRNRPTVFSSNYSKTELVNKRHYDERLVQRIFEMCPFEYHMEGEPMRIICAMQRRERVKELLFDNEEYSLSDMLQAIAPWWAKYAYEFERAYNDINL